MPKDYALRKLYSKVIICGCDAISGLLIHHQLDELFGRCEYKILHQYDLQLQKDWEWNTDEPIPDKDIIKEWFFEEPERIITTCWEPSKLYMMHELLMCASTSFVNITDLPF